MLQPPPSTGPKSLCILAVESDAATRSGPGHRLLRPRRDHEALHKPRPWGGGAPVSMGQIRGDGGHVGGVCCGTGHLVRSLAWTRRVGGGAGGVDAVEGGFRCSAAPIDPPASARHHTATAGLREPPSSSHERLAGGSAARRLLGARPTPAVAALLRDLRLLPRAIVAARGALAALGRVDGRCCRRPRRRAACVVATGTAAVGRRLLPPSKPSPAAGFTGGDWSHRVRSARRCSSRGSRDGARTPLYTASYGGPPVFGLRLRRRRAAGDADGLRLSLR